MDYTQELTQECTIMMRSKVLESGFMPVLELRQSNVGSTVRTPGGKIEAISQVLPFLRREYL